MLQKKYVIHCLQYAIRYLYSPTWSTVCLSLRLCCLIPVLPVIYVITTISCGRQLVHELETFLKI